MLHTGASFEESCGWIFYEPKCGFEKPMISKALRTMRSADSKFLGGPVVRAELYIVQGGLA